MRVFEVAVYTLAGVGITTILAEIAGGITKLASIALLTTQIVYEKAERALRKRRVQYQSRLQKQNQYNQ